MNAILRLLILPLFVAVAVLALPARGQGFFRNGIDNPNYVPNVPGTPAGRLYVGDLFGPGNCHFRLNLPPGKPVTKVELRWVGDLGNQFPVVTVTRSGGEVTSYHPSEFDRVDRFGNPCPPNAAAPVPAGAETPTDIPVSNDADSFALTCDGRYAVVVGANSATPVSLVDFAAGAEVDTFAADSNVTYAETFDDGESVVVVQNIPPQNDTNRLRRLRIVNGEFVDTGESLAPAGGNPDRRFVKVFAVPGSKVGVALGQFGAPGVTTFSIPGLQVLDSFPAGGDSASVSCAGDKVYVRGGPQIKGYTIDRVTGALGDTPFLTISNVGPTDSFATNFGNALAISRDGTQLIATEGTAFPNSPPTPRVTAFDTTTGERLGFFDAFDGGSPTLVATYPCCAAAGMELGIQQLASGLIQISATGEIGRNYELQKSQNLAAWDKLLEFQMTVSPTPYTDPDSQTNSTRFYRLKLNP